MTGSRGYRGLVSGVCELAIGKTQETYSTPAKIKPELGLLALKPCRSAA